MGGCACSCERVFEVHPIADELDNDGPADAAGGPCEDGLDCFHYAKISFSTCICSSQVSVSHSCVVVACSIVSPSNMEAIACIRMCCMVVCVLSESPPAVEGSAKV
jgi:hypothetical protein